MKKIIFLVLILISVNNAWGVQTIQVNTKYGYITDPSGHPVGKYSDFNQGPLEIPDGYSYVEVANQSELNAIKLYRPTLPIRS